MLYRNAELLDGDFRLLRADLRTHGKRIVELGQALPGEETLDCSGLLLAPGLVDVHIHGCVGADTSDGRVDSIRTMAAQLPHWGVTAFCPTTMTVPDGEIRAALRAVRAAMEAPAPGQARVLGAHMEGPFISPAKKGAQAAQAVQPPDFARFQSYFQESGQHVKLLSLAPDVPGATRLIRAAKELCTVSVAHTAADYNCAMAAFDAGASHATHLYNAMTGFSHREPGVVGAVFDHGNVSAELICDGFHIHPAALRLAFRQLGAAHVCVISDSMRAAGLPDGASELGGQTVFVRNGQARLADDTIAGSTANLLKEVQNLVAWGVPLPQAFRAASLTPAREVGEDELLGSLVPGKAADLLLLDRGSLQLRGVVLRGQRVL